jgi:hypothetical protein
MQKCSKCTIFFENTASCSSARLAAYSFVPAVKRSSIVFCPKSKKPKLYRGVGIEITSVSTLVQCFLHYLFSGHLSFRDYQLFLTFLLIQYRRLDNNSASASSVQKYVVRKLFLFLVVQGKKLFISPVFKRRTLFF